jgi:pimeloyl-ACP methyl ester carboxylesterase
MYDEKSPYFKILGNLISHETKKNIDDYVAKIKVPTLLILGEQDYLIPYKQTSKYFMSQLNDLEMYVIKDARHTPSTQFPQLVNTKIIDFVKRINKKEF